MKLAVLGLIVERRGYGYDLIRRFNERFGRSWDLNPSTVYASLDDARKGADGHRHTTKRRRRRTPRKEPTAPRRIIYKRPLRREKSS